MPEYDDAFDFLDEDLFTSVAENAVPYTFLNSVRGVDAAMFEEYQEENITEFFTGDRGIASGVNQKIASESIGVDGVFSRKVTASPINIPVEAPTTSSAVDVLNLTTLPEDRRLTIDESTEVSARVAHKKYTDSGKIALASQALRAYGSFMQAEDIKDKADDEYATRLKKAENYARTQTRETDTQVRQLFGVSAGHSQGASFSQGTVGSVHEKQQEIIKRNRKEAEDLAAARRDALREQASRQKTQAGLGLLGSAIGYASGTGPVGAAIGGAIGGILGGFL